MRAGLLKHRILLQHLISTGDEFTDDTQTYIDYGKRWSAMRSVSSKEVDASNGKVMNSDVVFTVRFSSDLTDIDNTWRIWYRNRRYQVKGVVNIKFSDRWLELLCRMNRQNLRLDNNDFDQPLSTVVHQTIPDTFND